jgi:hypothetical protein
MCLDWKQCQLDKVCLYLFYSSSQYQREDFLRISRFNFVIKSNKKNYLDRPPLQFQKHPSA